MVVAERDWGPEDGPGVRSSCHQGTRHQKALSQEEGMAVG